MKLLSAGIFVLAILALGLFFGASVRAQTPSSSASSSLTAAQTVGPENNQKLQQAFSALGSTFNRLDAMLRVKNQISNRAAISASLSAIRGSLLAIDSTVAALDNRAQGVAESSAPKLPNSGAGGARYLR